MRVNSGFQARQGLLFRCGAYWVALTTCVLVLSRAETPDPRVTVASTSAPRPAEQGRRLTRRHRYLGRPSRRVGLVDRPPPLGL